MKSIVAVVLASIAAVGLLSACGDDDPKVTVPTDETIASGLDISIPDIDTVPAGAIPTGTVPDALIDQMITQLAAAGMTLDKECFKNLLADESLRNIIAAGGGAPSQEAIQKMMACIKT